MKKIKKIPITNSAYNYQLLIKRILESGVSYAPNQEIVYKDLVRITYARMFERIRRLCSALERMGVKPGDTVAVMDWDTHRYLELFFAIPMMGAILHTVNVRLSSDQILYTMNHAEDSIVMANSEFIPILEEIAPQLGSVREFILIRDEAETPEHSMQFAAEYESMIDGADPNFEFPDFDENAQATLFYTTGTTGNPKGVYFSHRQLVLHTLAVATAVSAYTAPGRFQSGDVYMPMTAMFHVHAWGFPYVATLIGAKQVYPGRFQPETALKLIQDEKVTFTHCVSTILHMLINHPNAKSVDFSKLKMNTGGMALTKGLALKALSLGIDLFHGYGMSETCPILTLATLKPHMMEWDLEMQVDYRTKTGFPVPFVQLLLESEDGNSLTHDGVSQGELIVRTPWCTQGYFNEPEKSEELWKDGFLHTNDVAVIDPDGYVQIKDRLKDVIKTGGEWVSSLLLESLLSRNPAVLESAVVGKYDERWGERPVALVVLQESRKGELTQNDLKDFLMQFVEEGLISKWSVPDEFIFVDSVPKTSVGKINKKLIRAEL